ncbi:MAG: SpoIIE family protein phosphatase [Campylobacterota bacterium]|nr:SpoIIE family protein phosphatase [Campylobacterota bacterium]
MNSISIRFALASVSVALFILALTGSINYLFLKEELLRDATQKAKLIEENSVYKIQTIISKTKEYSLRLQESLQEDSFDREIIKKTLIKALKQEPYFYGMAMAFEPKNIYNEPFSPYYYKGDDAILYADLALNNYNYLEKEWYTTPKKKRNNSWSEPYFDEGGGDILMATYSTPIMQNHKFLGVLTIDLSLKKLQEIISSISILESGYAFLLSKEYKILVDPDKKKIMKQYYKNSFEYSTIIKEDERWLYYAHVASTGLTLGIVLPHGELFSSLHRMSLISIILAIVGSILLIITMILISRRISQPLQDVTSLTQEISLGNFDKKIKLPKTKDEIYHLSLSINRMQDSIKHYVKDLKDATIKEERIESELDIARAIQMSMLPKALPKNEHISLDATLKPAKAVGGDFYDYFHISDNEICFVIADVSGKGVPAAMFMAVTMSYIRAYSVAGLTPSKIVNRLNNTMAQNNDANMFVTLFLAILDVKSGELSYVNAGHTKPYIISHVESLKPLEQSGNPIVGAFGNIEYAQETTVLQDSEKLFLYTDGVNEAFSKDDEQFGEKRVKALLESFMNLSPTECIQKVQTSLDSFCEECEQSDDITMLIIEYK